MKNKIKFSKYTVSLIFVVLALTFQTLSCNQYSKKYKTASQKVNQLMDETIILPQNNKVLFKDSIYKKFPLKDENPKIKITTFIQGDCKSCIKEILKWNHFLQYSDSIKDLSIYFYLHTSDIKHFRNYLYEKEIHTFPLYLTSNIDYLYKNDLPFDKKQYHTLLLDSTNKIILVGNPIYSIELMELYKEEIEKRLKE